jgi:hypothetical protein
VDLDDIRQLLYAYTKELSSFVEENGTESLYEEVEVEALVEEFLSSHDDLLGEAAVEMPEESY